MPSVAGVPEVAFFSGEFAMRKLFAGLMVAIGLFCGVTWAQNAQTPATQPGAAGQKQGEPAGQGQSGLLQQGQAAPGRAAQPAAVQPGVAQPATTQPGAIQPRPAIAPGQTLVPGQAVVSGQAGQTGQAHQGGSADQEIAACVYGECHNEIEIAKLAESKTQSEEVRDFAQRMVRDHSPGCQEMQRLAGSLAADAHHGGSNANQSRGASGGHLDWMSVKKEIGQQCLKSVKEELSSKQGTDFDKCFMGQQIGAHMKVVDELTVLRNHASSELKQKLDKELETAKQHLQLAKQIEQKLKDHPSERVSRRPEGNK